MEIRRGTIGVEMVDEYVAEVVMRRTEKHNAFNAQMMDDLVSTLAVLDEGGVRAAILRAEPGVKVWSAGHDIAELPTSDPLAWANPLEDMLAAVRRTPYPVIAAVEGGAFGGAFDLALSVDMIVATEASRFAITPAKLGVAYNPAGIAGFLSALPRQLVAEMFYTSEPVSAKRLAELGVVSKVVSDEVELTHEARALAQTISKRAPLTIRAAKADLVGLAWDTSASGEDVKRAMRSRQAAWSSADYMEGLGAFNERRTPHFKGQ